ncbi:DNA polymerase subunit Cdc27 [Mycena alexandri]|uniref:DNA polymerase delta subunit 3 n=1 Tax=Mycena alexandri TaxID=1745969 RepID=A0AAD6SYQ6_9AGAR|nr:DNA polymerase subunit Cdc27 [Mycena alexandri]
MSTQPIRDYLTKQLLIEKNIVTYRSLSRILALNVNIAKNELADFHATDGQNLAATYLLSGETLAAQKRLDEDIDMDDRDPYDDDADEGEDGEYVPQTEIVLVGEKELESVQAQFVTLESFHVYSLSPSAIRDAGLLCTPTEIVRDLDKTKGAELAAVVGRVIGADVNVSTKPQPGWGGRKVPPAPVAGSSKTPAAGTSMVKKEEDAKPKEKAKPEKPKATGKLDFSKAKTKPVKKEEEKKEKPLKADTKRKAESRAPSVASTIGEKVHAKMEESKKGSKRKSALASDSEDEVAAKPAKPAKPAPRGVKRKSALASDSEDEVKATKPAKPVVQAQSSVRVRKGVVLSDDEDDAPARKGKGKAKATAVDSESEAEKNLRAMMDIDDDAVTRASRDAREPEPEDDPMEAIIANMSDGDSKPAPVKRKPKKVVPVGKNGLKKKRIVKSKTRIDEKGYMVTEDFSEYESVDEEEEEPAPPKAKAKTKSTTADTAPAKAKPAPKPAPAKAKPKPSGSSKGAQQTGLASFFGKSKSK